MVDLPRIPRRLVTTEAAQSSVTAADIRAPYAQLASGLDKLGEGLEDVSVRVAAREGVQAVTTDAAGNLKVEEAPLLSGRAGAAFNRAAQNRFMSEIDAKIRQVDLEKRLEFEGKPQEYKQWADGYVDELSGRENTPEMAAAVKTLAKRHVDQTYQGLVLQRQRLDTEASRTSLLSRLSILDNEMAALARQQGVDTEAFKARQADARALYEELGKNPLFNYPKERVDGEVATMQARHQAEAVIGKVEQLYDKSGKAEAKRFLQTAIWDPALNLTEQQRNQYVARGVAALDAKTADQTVAQRAHKGTVEQHVKLLEEGAQYDPRRHNEIIDRAVTLGDAESVYKLEAAAFFNQNLRAFRSASDADRTIMLQRATGGGLVERIVGVESGGDPNARNPASTATGAGQFINSTWLDIVKRTRPDVAAGKSDVEILALRKDAALSREMTGRYAEENRARLSAAGVRTDDGALYLAHFLGPQDAIRVLSAPGDTPVAGLVNQASINANKSIFGKYSTAGAIADWAGRKVGTGTSTAAVMTPYNPFIDRAVGQLAVEYRKELSTSLDRNVERMIEGYKKRQMATAEELQQVVQWVLQTGNVGAGKKLADFLESYDRGSLLSGLPTTQREQVLGAMRTQAAQEGATPATRAVIDELTRQHKLAGDGMKADPLNEAAVRGWIAPPGGLDVTSPEAVAASMPTREAGIATIQAHDPTVGATSALTGSEPEAMRTALTKGDPQVAAGLLGALARLSPDTLRATLSTGPMKEALDGMIRSYDPVRLEAAMTSLDRMWRADAIGFSKTFGAETQKRLQIWQAFKDTASAAEIAARFQRADDPAFAKAREELRNQATNELKNVKVADVVGALDKAERGGLLSSIPFTGPSAPADGLQAGALKVEFDTLYKEFRSFGLDADKAKEKATERLKTVWGSSAVQGGQIMRYPPERYYGAVDGSRDWMKTQIETDLAATLGKPKIKASAEGLRGGVSVENWSYRLMTTPETEADIAAGRRPRYAVTITDKATGRDTVLMKTDQTPRLYQWDDTALLAASRARFTERREAMQMFGTPQEFMIPADTPMAQGPR